MSDKQNLQQNIKSIVVIDKPHGITSMTVVRKLRRLLKPLNITKVGYAGTLDPYATGVLVVGVGREGTRQLGDLTNKNKEYVCEIDLLKDSPSGDMENFKGEYQRDVKDLPKDFQPPTIDQIKQLILDKFIGEIRQTPPKLSAIKMNGKKACDMVRSGEDFEMKERSVTLFETEVLEYAFPVLKLRVKCSKGTYIRTIGQDIGKNLGLWGTLLSLRRTVSGDHGLEEALTLDTMTLADLTA